MRTRLDIVSATFLMAFCTVLVFGSISPAQVLAEESTSSSSSSSASAAAVPVCNGHDATVYVANGTIVGGANAGQHFMGTLQGTGSDDVIVSPAGDSTVHGNGGNDTICTQAGNDTIVTTDGSSWISSGGGNDRVTVGNGNNMIFAGDGDDVVTAGDGINAIDGGGGANVIAAGNGHNSVITGDANDRVTAGDGGNSVSTNGGADTVVLGNGNDVIDGGADYDICRDTGGSNAITNCESDGNSSSSSSSSTSSVSSSSSSSSVSSSTGGEGSSSSASSSSSSVAASSSSASSEASSSSSSSSSNVTSEQSPPAPGGSGQTGESVQTAFLLAENGAHRGHQTNAVASALQAAFILATNDEGTGNLVSSATDMTGDVADASLTPVQGKVICSAQMLIGTTDEAMILWTAQWLSDTFGWDNTSTENALRDTSRCTEIYSVRNGETDILVALADTTDSDTESTLLPFFVDEKGVPVSSDPLWNACIRHWALHDQDGVAFNCPRFHNGPQWRHPDHAALIFTWADRSITYLDLPSGYVVTPVRGTMDDQGYFTPAQ